ncbi:MAG: YIP1 family protein [Lachnospiraceae bacterium]|nr:YIP1 family protein [Lachnospiraceae bacterium]
MSRAYRKKESKEDRRERRAANLARYKETLKFGFYCISHPLDGFWKLTHEHRGSLAAANTILILAIFTRIIKLKYTSFLFLQVYWEDINIFLYIASIIFPLSLWVVGNWALTTLFDGKGRLGDVYIGTCYGMLPYPLIQIPLMIVSNFVTIQEGQFYSVLSVLSLVWCLILIICGMGQVHAYSAAKTLLFTIASVAAVLVMIFLLMIFFSMVTQGVSYFISIGRELMYRM